MNKRQQGRSKGLFMEVLGGIFGWDYTPQRIFIDSFYIDQNW